LGDWTGTAPFGPNGELEVPEGTAALLEAAPEAVPVEPVEPPTATGLEIATEVALPVSPVLVDDDWAVEAPELPEVAVGAAVRLAEPPAPPMAEPVATEVPPLPRLLALPPTSDRAVPPSPPLPPVTAALMVLLALPVSPDRASACDSAPELAWLVESALTVTLGVVSGGVAAGAAVLLLHLGDLRAAA